MNSKLIIVGGVVIVVLIVLQFFSPKLLESEYATVAQFEKETQVTGEVRNLLQTKCYDCHGGATEYPWYAKVAPVSFWIGHHIEEGQEHFDIMKWDNYSVKKKDHKLDELIEEVEENEMPLESYNWLHGGLTDSEKNTLISWAKNVRKEFVVEESK